MYIGEQFGDVTEVSDERLTLSAQLGVEHVVIHALEEAGHRNPAMRIQGHDGAWELAAVRRLQRYLAQFGMTIDALHHELGSLHWDLAHGRSPERVAAGLDIFRRNIWTAARARIPCIKYNLNVIGIVRTGWRLGRGGARYAHFSIDEASDEALARHTIYIDKGQARAAQVGRLAPEQSWCAIERLLDALIPVAEEAGVYLACHPQDPAFPADGLHGIHHVLGSVEGMKRFISIAPSRYNVFNFCQGTVAEMCKEPATEVLEAIRYFGSRGRIYMVHFRNIKGGYLDFDEVYPDNGDVDMYEAMKTYKGVGFRGMMVPDHAPASDVDPGRERQFAFALGYTKALIQTVDADAASEPTPLAAAEKIGSH